MVVTVNQWGDIVDALAGGCGRVTTIIGGTAGDPHDYEPVTRRQRRVQPRPISS